MTFYAMDRSSAAVALAGGDSDGVMQARFLYRFGTDVMSAQGLSERAALELRDEINVALQQKDAGQ